MTADPFAGIDAEDLIDHPGQRVVPVEGFSDGLAEAILAEEHASIWWGPPDRRYCWSCGFALRDVRPVRGLCADCVVDLANDLPAPPIPASQCKHELCDGLRWCTRTSLFPPAMIEIK